MLLLLGNAASAVLAATILDAFVARPVSASVTTLVPGMVYASATVMKVCLVAGVLAAGVALIRRLSSTPAAPGVPIWGIVSIALVPLASFVGAVVVLAAQSLARGPITVGRLSEFSRIAVIVQLIWIAAGAGAAVVALVRRERPRLLPALGLVMSVLLIGLFWHLEFYALGFDQDTWAPLRRP